MQTAFMLAGGLASAIGQSQAQEYAAAQSKRAAQIGKIQADQIDASYRAELNDTISSIRALRAGAGVGMDSPTGMAIEANEERKSNRDRRIEVGNRRMQAFQDEQDARFRKRAGQVALFSGVAGTLGKSWGGISDFFGQ